MALTGPAASYAVILLILLQLVQMQVLLLAWHQLSLQQSTAMTTRRPIVRKRTADEDEDADDHILLIVVLYSWKITDREFWSRFRVDEWSETWVRDLPDSYIWKQVFGMVPSSMHKLCCILAPELIGKDSNARAATPVWKKVVVAVHYMRTGEKYLLLGQRFGVGQSTAHKYVHDVSAAIVKVMQHEYIRLPQTRAECQELMKQFYQLSQFPNVIGCVDGVHFEIVKPNGVTGHEYTNRKFDTSVVCQCMCDHQSRFMDVVAAWPGSVHDSRVMSESSLQRKGIGRLLGQGMQCVVLGDAGYAIQPWLITPFTQRGRRGLNLARNERRFNLRLSKTRVKIEHAFGMLKGRFRSLLTVINMQPKYVSSYLLACMVLHNYCIMEKDTFLESWRVLPDLDVDSDSSSDDESDDSGDDMGDNVPPFLDDAFDQDHYVDANAYAIAARAVDQAANRGRRRAQDHYAHHRAGFMGLFEQG